MAEIIASTYELIEKIGSGGGGVVYLARHLRLDKNVVLKADKRKITTRSEILRREVDALKDLNHTYIPQVYDYFVENETVYTVIDYVEGESLDKPLKRGERFSQPQVIKWACQMLEALCYLHKPVHGNPPRGIVHSDIKPANIMLTPSGDIRLIDFNIALALGEENVVGLSAGYASPEHYGLDFSTDTSIYDSQNNLKTYKSVNSNIKEDEYAGETVTDTVGENIYSLETKTMLSNGAENNNKEIVIMTMKPSASVSSTKKNVVPDARSDIYSLGATLYHLLSGKRPAKSAIDVVPLSKKEFSPLIADIISKAMNPDPNMRYQTADEMLYDLTHLREKDKRSKKLKRTLYITSAMLAAALTGSVFTAFTGLKRMEALQKSLTLAEYSQNVLEEGNKELAVKYALDALPVDKSIFTPKYTSQAKKALADSLGVYDLADGFKTYDIIQLPSEALKTVLSPDGKKGATVYAFAVAVFDTESGEITATLPTVKSALADVVFINEDTIVYGGEEGLTVYNVKENERLWTGKPATHIAVSADGQTIAGIYRDEGFATVYDINGNEKATVFFQGKKQYIVENDTFADPMDNLMTLSDNGQYLAVSFENGGLMLFDILNPINNGEVYEKSDFFHFEGGFYGKYFAFSATNESLSEFGIIDMDMLEYTISFWKDGRIGVVTDEKGIYVSNLSTIVTMDPVTGEQKEAAYTDSDVKAFAVSNGKLITATEKNECLFYDVDGKLMNRYGNGQAKCDFVDIKGEYAVVSGRDTPVIKILKSKNNSSSDIWNYDKNFEHSEARINKDETSLMLFDYKGFEIYDKNGTLINEVSIPDAEKVYDQQYSKNSGNLAVMYNDGLRIYSGVDGSLIYEETGIKSVMYTNYGVSIMDGANNVKLVNTDTGEAEECGNVKGNNGYYCGINVDDSILNGRKLIGAGKTSQGFYFAAAAEDVCTVYNGNGKELFTIPYSNDSEVFFTEGKIFISPLHGTPVVYSLDREEKIAELEKDSYLTYITKTDNYIVSQYMSTAGEYYGILLDEDSLEPVAYMKNLSDINNNMFIFDFHKGVIRKSYIYSIDELISIAKQ